MPDYRRAWVPGGTYFFTVNLLERRRRLLVERIDVLGSAFRAARPFSMPAWVMLPDHLHGVWVRPEGDADIATRWRHIKTLFSRAVPTGKRRTARRLAKAERGVWQRRYWEHAIRSEADLHAHIDDIHINPVKHGHAARDGLAAFVVPSACASRRLARGLGLRSRMRLAWGRVNDGGSRPALRHERATYDQSDGAKRGRS